ncbi:uncharacterized protein LOC124368943 isoform X1 [Homalodisca vitripennis]|uniref:uncharacterized protein LOC124368943 isoform X1 n=2 Tax=Homalodisca vitripennis TaxID=197043 RepID=UPI001EEA6AAB|nr:uncharacterized protein LOC124368943 isoform X1 [Homalodisca vitripennis]XP_046682462.1 uncharacterized protein LOC124368943 isoform X1 [Homalodisca vitripennis]XP_046682463.1 uncharacterized protein LOC124368943 isoform X1 [Homalodisca vitripennis]XP_046682464.1 uncharacterized protein LOC124368943 isoform X1 [Homalodisca vitripennis]XP_046682465.1 uncharacterized protein LOC124368943 isoform X1 [Homalodisca vitripennis]
MASDILQEVTVDEIPRVLEAMKKDWPQHFLLHQFVSILEEYHKENIQNPKQVLYKYGDFEDGVYIVKSTFAIGAESVSLIYPYTTAADYTEFSKVLSETTRIPWTEKFMFEVTARRLMPTIQQVSAAKGCDLGTEEGATLFLPPESDIENKLLPEDVYLGSLDEHHVAEVNENWPFKYPGSEKFVALQIQNNFGLGLFRKSDNKMLSSSVSFHSGGIFILYSNPNFRSRGYGEVIIREMAKEIRRQGRIPFGNIMTENIVSTKLFNKMGFKEYYKSVYLFPKKLFNFAVLKHCKCCIKGLLHLILTTTHQQLT